MIWAYPWTEYVEAGREKTSIWRPLWDSINYTDFVVEIFGSLKYYLDALRGKPETRATQGHPGTRMYRSRTGGDMAGPGTKMDFATAFGVYTPRAETDKELGADDRYHDGEGIRLAPYHYKGSPSSPDPDIS